METLEWTNNFERGNYIVLVDGIEGVSSSVDKSQSKATFNFYSAQNEDL